MRDIGNKQYVAAPYESGDRLEVYGHSGCLHFITPTYGAATIRLEDIPDLLASIAALAGLTEGEK